MSGRITVDTTKSSSVAVCECGFRGASLTATGAWSLARAHEVAAHRGEQQVSNALAQRRHRAAA